MAESYGHLGRDLSTNINNGSQDAHITAQATRLKNLGAPVILRYFHETRRRLPQHHHRIPGRIHRRLEACAVAFHGRGRNERRLDVHHGGIPAPGHLHPSPQAFYPGHDQVDWIDADGYSLQTILAKWYAWAATMPKPLNTNDAPLLLEQ